VVVVVVLVEEEGCESVWMAAGKVTSSLGSVHLIVVAIVRGQGQPVRRRQWWCLAVPAASVGRGRAEGGWEGCAVHGFSLGPLL
jgi:hypothetical protein